MVSPTTVKNALEKETPKLQGFKIMSVRARPGWPVIQSTDITEWEGFNLESLTQRFSRQLGFHYLGLHGNADQALIAALSECENSSEDATLRVAEQSTVTFYNDAVLPLLWVVNPGEVFAQFSTLFPGTVRPTMPRKARNMRFDYYIGLRDSYLSGLVVGLFVAEADFAGRALLGGEEAQLRSKTQLRRLANMCQAANTNYGFIQTEGELMVCRFRRAILSRRWKAEVQSVYCVEPQPKELTTRLALWFLCMLAISEKQSRANWQCNARCELLGAAVCAFVGLLSYVWFSRTL